MMRIQIGWQESIPAADVPTTYDKEVREKQRS
jgi:hypothetical protein